MLRSVSAAVFLFAASLGFAAQGQETRNTAPAPSSAVPGQPANAGHIAPTGKTLPNPGVPQASGTTDLDRKIQQQDDRTQEICKGC